MDYIGNKIKEQLAVNYSRHNHKDYHNLIHAYLQYKLFFCFGILYNEYKQKELIGFNEEIIIRPPLGLILEACRDLNKRVNFFPKWKQIEFIFSNYIEHRNKWDGHGFTYSYDSSEQIKLLEEFISKIDILESKLSDNYNIIKVESLEKGFYLGVTYGYKGNVSPWKYKKSKFSELEIGSIYYQNQNLLKRIAEKISGSSNLKYYKVTPFIEVENDEYYIFQSIREPMIGKISYQNIFRTEQIEKIYANFEKFAYFQEEEFSQRELSKINNTIRNRYEKNYDKFINVNQENDDSFTTNIKKFLGNKSGSVATIWGHGGVGKTASLQKLCEDIFFDKISNLRKKNLLFNYIIFLSAKDRIFNYYTGQIEKITKDKLNTFQEVVQKSNQVIFNESSNSTDKLLHEFSGRLLLVIDDFETFEEGERNKIHEFLNLLDVNHHKVVLTTRIASAIGTEIVCPELNCEETIFFLKEILQNILNIKLAVNDLKKRIEHNAIEIHNLTTGRPIFIFHLAHLLAQNLEIEELCKADIKSSKHAIEFLYGRFYNYLNDNTKIIFKSLPMLTHKSSLTCRVSNLKYIIDLTETEFRKSINELEKLRVITLTENRDFISIYTNEILHIMEEKLHEDPQLEKLIKEKLDKEIIRGTTKSIFEQKLFDLRTKERIVKSLSDILESYEKLIQDTEFSRSERLTAFGHLLTYLSKKTSNRDIALEVCNEYSLYFRDDSRYTWLYFLTLKDSGKLDKAISLAKNYLEAKSSEAIEVVDSLYFSIAGEFLRINSKTLTNIKNDINSSIYLEESERKTQSYHLKSEMISLIKDVKIIFSRLLKFEYSNLRKTEKAHIEIGLLLFARMLRRVLTAKGNQPVPERLEFFLTIADFGITNFSANSRDELITLKWNVTENDFKEHFTVPQDKSSKNELSDFAEELKKAQNEKDHT